MARILVVIGIALLAQACGGRLTPRVPLATDDAALANRARTALLNEPTVHGNEITVTVQDGVLVLQGQVHGTAEADAAVAAARRVEGVKDVRSELQPSR
jgi:osmotically-inducible protein OsmY